MKNSRQISRREHGFTIVELTVIVIIMGIIATVAIIGIGSWRQRSAETEVRSDLQNVATAMENARNFGAGYPTALPDGFKESPGVSVTYQSGDAKTYCIEARSKKVSSVAYFLSSDGGTTPKKGTCAGGEGAVPVPNDSSQTIFAYDTTLPGCSSNTIQLPIQSPISGGTIHWGDGKSEALSSSLQSHVYSSPGKYTVAYSGPIAVINTQPIASSARGCLSEVKQWSDSITPTRLTFQHSVNLTSVPRPPSSVLDMTSMFSGANLFNQPIDDWNTANVINMTNMFSDATAFNQPIGNWNTANVTNMSGMFARATSFNQPIGNWNVSKVTWMNAMFNEAHSFNQPLSTWNVSAVTHMPSLFNGAYAFNQPIGNWNTNSLTNANSMFLNATAFNQPIGNWNMSKLTDTNHMFSNARAFNQPIGNWDMGRVTTMNWMFQNAVLFNQNLSGWNVNSVTTRPPTNFAVGATAWLQPKPNW